MVVIFFKYKANVYFKKHQINSSHLFSGSCYFWTNRKNQNPKIVKNET